MEEEERGRTMTVAVVGNDDQFCCCRNHQYHDRVATCRNVTSLRHSAALCMNKRSYPWLLNQHVIIIIIITISASSMSSSSSSSTFRHFFPLLHLNRFVCVRVCGGVLVCMCVCARARARARAYVCLYLCVCLCLCVSLCKAMMTKQLPIKSVLN